MSLQRTATVVSSITAFLLLIIKFIVWILSWSIAVLSSAIDSILDLFASVFNYFAIRKSEKAPDKKFNYGRWKIEAFASMLEWIIILLSAIYIFYESINKIINKEEISYLWISIIVMIVSIIITFLLVIYLDYIAKKTKNIVIEADSLHYKTDLYSNAWIILWLAIIYFTWFFYIDSIIGIIIAIYIGYSAIKLTKKWFFLLMDVALDENEVKKIKEIVEKNHKSKLYHDFKTRQSWSDKFVEFHLVFDTKISLVDSHKIADLIEIEISKIDKNFNRHTTIHLDPYDDSK